MTVEDQAWKILMAEQQVLKTLGLLELQLKGAQKEERLARGVRGVENQKPTFQKERIQRHPEAGLTTQQWRGLLSSLAKMKSSGANRNIQLHPQTRLI